ncbi:MAG: RNA polymerase sigma factor [Isosphaeraceae bacterium]
MADDRAVFEQLVDLHGASVLAFLRRLCGRDQDADDVFQDVALRVWKNLGSRPRLRNPRGWMMTIAYRAFLDHRARMPRLVPLQEGDAIPSQEARQRDPSAIAQQVELESLVQDCLSDLPWPIRSVVALHYAGGLSIHEVARTLGIPPGTAKSRLNSALEQLRRRLS